MILKHIQSYEYEYTSHTSNFGANRASSQGNCFTTALPSCLRCVCHLEDALGWRQAYISQHLRALRKANILADRHEGRFVFCRLTDPAYLDFIGRAAEIVRAFPAIFS
jgi:DNA-binding transcriptional ArsR family regulator